MIIRIQEAIQTLATEEYENQLGHVTEQKTIINRFNTSEVQPHVTLDKQSKILTYNKDETDSMH